MHLEIKNGDTLVDLFEKQAKLEPSSVAIEYGHGRLTYGELRACVNDIALRLHRRGVTPLSNVGVNLEAGSNLISVLLAIMKVGAAYVPIDRHSPVERIKFIASDAQLRTIVTDNPALRDSEFLQLHELISVTPPDDLVSLPSIPMHADIDAYVIYTSGSTGKPKGVICTHRNVIRLFTSTEPDYQFSNQDRWTLFHSVAFDFSVWEIFGALLYGGTLVIVPATVARDTSRFARLLVQSEVTVLNQTPSAFYNLIGITESHNIDCFSQLRFVILGGERLQLSKVRQWLERPMSKRPKLVNMYGITETTVHVTFREINLDDVLSSPSLSPIGLPIRDLSIYLTDPELKLVKAGESGEICVAGPGVARGYLNRPELTAERFVRNPFGADMHPILYRSGDLGQQLSSGEFCHLGRLDRQVKIRGYRIELGEIENVLLKTPGIASAHDSAIDSGTGDMRITAFVVPSARTSAGAMLEARLRFHKSAKFLALDSDLDIVYLNRSETVFMYKEIFKDRVYEKLGVRFRDEACIVDVGANIGMFCLFSLRKCQRPTLVAIESVPACVEILKINLERYGANASVHGVVLSDRSGDGRFRYLHHATVSSGGYAGKDEASTMAAYLSNEYTSPSESPGIEDEGMRALFQAKLEYSDMTCPVRTLSALIDSERLTRIDILKIDVEENEFDVLNGIREQHWPLIEQIVLEFHDVGGRLAMIQGILESRGYSCRVTRDALSRGTALCNLYASSERCSEELRRTPNDDAAEIPISSQHHALIALLRQTCAGELPSYMVPPSIHLLPELPLTMNGKVDEGKLSAMVLLATERPTGFTDPIEQEISLILKEILKLENIDTHRGLGDLGASSLTMVVIAMRLYQRFKVEIPVSHMHDEISIVEIANEIRRKRDARAQILN